MARPRRSYPPLWVNIMDRRVNPKAIIAARYARQWSQLDLADYLGVERTSVQRWEHGKSFPRGQNADKLALFIQRTRREIRTNQLKPPKGYDELLETLTKKENS